MAIALAQDTPPLLLNYRSSVLNSLPAAALVHLQTVLNRAVRVRFNTLKSDPCSSLLHSQWLAIHLK